MVTFLYLLIALLYTADLNFALSTPRHHPTACSSSAVVSNSTLLVGGKKLQLQSFSCKESSALSRRSPQLNPNADPVVVKTVFDETTVTVTIEKISEPPVHTVTAGPVTKTVSVSRVVTVTATTAFTTETKVDVITDVIPVVQPTTVVKPVTVTEIVSELTTVDVVSALPSTFTATSVRNQTFTQVSIQPSTVTEFIAEPTVVTVFSIEPTTVPVVSTVTLTASAVSAPSTSSLSSLGTNVCNELCKNSCGSSSVLPPISEDCATVFDSISLFDDVLPPTFDVLSGHVQQLSFGTCLVYFQNFGPDTLTFCWSALAQEASVAGTQCFPPTQPIQSLGLCASSDGAWEVGITHS